MKEKPLTIEQLRTDQDAQSFVRLMDILNPVKLERNTIRYSRTLGSDAAEQVLQHE